MITIYLVTRLLSFSPDRTLAGTPEAVIVTLIDPDNMSNEYISRIKENRQDYADRHGMRPHIIFCKPILTLSG